MLVSSAAGFRFIGNNRIISFVLIKYKKIFSLAAMKKKNPTEKRASCMCGVMFCLFKTCLNLFDFAYNKLSNEISRKDISFLFSFLNHYLKK